VRPSLTRRFCRSEPSADRRGQVDDRGDDPPELPLHACRPANGLLNELLIVRVYPLLPERAAGRENILERAGADFLISKTPPS